VARAGSRRTSLTEQRMRSLGAHKPVAARILFSLAAAQEWLSHREPHVGTMTFAVLFALGPTARFLT